MKKIISAAFFGLAFAATQTARAATTDPCASLGNVVTRPTVANSVCTVEPNQVLLETGYTNISVKNVGNTVTYPQANLRIGTTISRLEVDMNTPSVTRMNGARGISDAGGGLKYFLGDSPKMQYSLQWSQTYPTGDSVFTAGATQSTYGANVNYTLSPAFTISTSQNFTAAVSNGVRYASYVPALAISGSLPHNFGAFGEVALFTNALGPYTPARYQYMYGLTYDAGSRVQLDVEEISSPTKNTGKYNGVGFGLAYMMRP